MDENGSPTKRTRRRRAHAPAGPPPEHTVETGPTPASVVKQADPPPPTGRPRRAVTGDRDAERGLRALIGAGPSQVPADVAMRVRDAARPTAEDLAEAERDTQVVRRNWKPPA